MTAGIFTLAVIVLDAGVIAPFVERSLAMVTSAIGMWLPFALIATATYVTGSPARPARALA